jgi:uncharacterized membrane protein YeaQ/YmgE (transglycosylase-associated protein family)
VHGQGLIDAAPSSTAGGPIANLVVGIVDTLLGAFLAALGPDIAGFWGSPLASTLGAILLLFIVGMLRPPRAL